MKELKILWMYHDIMDLYGDKGNMLVLTQRCRKRGIEITIDTCGIGEQKDVREYDLLFLGGGADREQMMLMDDLRARKEQIAQAMAEKASCSSSAADISCLASIISLRMAAASTD